LKEEGKKRGGKRELLLEDGRFVLHVADGPATKICDFAKGEKGGGGKKKGKKRKRGRAKVLGRALRSQRPAPPYGLWERGR